MQELEQDLTYTKENLQATIEEMQAANEELKSTNEELQSTNEELQSTNEELETSKEELQSVTPQPDPTAAVRPIPAPAKWGAHQVPLPLRQLRELQKP